MQRFEYLIRGDFHNKAEDVARNFGGREVERMNAYAKAITTELNALGADGWELVQGPDGASSRNWVFKRPLAEGAKPV